MKYYRYLVPVFALFIFACSSTSELEQVPILSSETATRQTITSTLGPSTPTPPNLIITQTPKWSQFITPSLTPSITPDYNAPIVQPPDKASTYSIVDWNPELANELISILREYPDTLSSIERGYHDSGYYAASDYARLAQAEAILRFPSSVYISDWEWDHAYQMAKMSSPGVAATYAALISEMLNNNSVDIKNLSKWFSEREPRLNIEFYGLEPNQEYTSSHLLEIATPRKSSGIYIWLLEQDKGFISYPLTSDADFGFSSDAGIFFGIEDATGDGIPEVITSHVHFPGSGDAWVTVFDVYDLSEVPPRSIDFYPPVTLRREREWTILPANDSGPGIRIDLLFDRWSCNWTIIEEEYRWNDEKFQLTNRSIPNLDQMLLGDQKTYGHCLDVLFFSALIGVQRGKPFEAAIVEQLIDEWPYSSDPWFPREMSDEPYTRDEARFVFGLFLALWGEKDAAINQFSLIVNQPSMADSRWLLLAQDFLQEYQENENLAKACEKVGICVDYLHLNELISLVKPQSYSPFELLDYLTAVGLPITNSGFNDFDEDGLLELWIVIKDRDRDLSYLYLIQRIENRYLAFSTTYPQDNDQINLRLIPPETDDPASPIIVDTGEKRLVLGSEYYHPDLGLLPTTCNHLDFTLDAIEAELLEGKRTNDIIQKLGGLIQLYIEIAPHMEATG